MNTIAFDRSEEGWDPYGGPAGHEPLPPRPRRRFLNRWSAGLIALLTAVGGFYAGVRVEKGQVSSSSSGASALASRFAALRAGASGASAASTGSGAAAGAARSGFAARFGAGGGGATVGSISSIKGDTIYLTETSGDVVQVKITSATKVTKSETVKPGALNPGNTLIVEGLKQANGTISATSVSDSGTAGSGFGLGALAGGGAAAGRGAGGGGGAGTSGSSSSGSAGTSVGSLFSSGG